MLTQRSKKTAKKLRPNIKGLVYPKKHHYKKVLHNSDSSSKAQEYLHNFTRKLISFDSCIFFKQLFRAYSKHKPKIFKHIAMHRMKLAAFIKKQVFVWG
ncbi:MAG: hypothetical protein A3K03_11370 [Bdellovibrionales bacterium RIFOXYD1_FULL_44_7]|nr:MAG: hypothetical protein A3K03_11370 [Bdellovibrionales bacterium RIFOXYD1_FULL_44_7]